MKTKINHLLGAVLSLLVTFGLTQSAAAQSERIVFYAPAIATNVSQKGHTVYYTTNHQIFSMNVDGTNVRQLTTGNENSYFPSWRPGQTHILFHRGGTLYVMDADGRGTFAVATARSYGADWSPDGRMVCYVGDPLSPPGPHDLWLVTVDPSVKGNKKVGTPILVSQGNFYHPVWSPDGTRIAFSDQLDPGGGPHIKVLDLATGTESLFASISGITPSWSPNGEQIAFSGKVTVTTTTSTNTYDELFIAKADSTELMQVTSFNSSVVWPTWSFDGTELAFRLGPGGTWNKPSIYKLTPGTGELTLLRDIGDHPDWKP